MNHHPNRLHATLRRSHRALSVGVPAALLASILGVGAIQQSEAVLVAAGADRTADPSARPVVPGTVDRQATRPIFASTGVWSAPTGSAFDFDYNSKHRITVVNRRSARPIEQKLRLSGRLEVRVLARAEYGCVVSMLLADCNVEPRDTPSPAAGHHQRNTVARKCHLLRQPTLILLGIDGEVRGYRFPATASGAERNILRAAYSVFSFRVPAAAGVTWTTTGNDATGVFEARYRREDPTAEGLVVIRREKLRSLRSTRLVDRAIEPKVGGRARAAFDPRLGWLVAAEVADTVALDLPDLGQCYHVAVDATLRLVGTSHRPVRESLDADRIQWSAGAGHREDVTESTLERRARLQRGLVGFELHRNLLALQSALDQKGFESSAVMALWNQLGDALRVQPDLADEIERVLLAGELSQDVASLALTALGCAGHPAAQAVLERAFDNPALDASTRKAALVSMHQVTAPSASLLERVGESLTRSDADGLWSTTLLAYGSLSGRETETKERDGRPTFQRLLALEARAGSEGSLPVWLEALGNASGPGTLQHAGRYLRSEDEHVRAGAVGALRRSREAGILPALSRHIDDPSAHVRRRLAEVLTQRPERHSVELLQRLATDKNASSVRRAAWLGLYQRARNDPRTRDILEHAAHCDPDVELSHLARRLLRTRSGDAPH